MDGQNIHTRPRQDFFNQAKVTRGNERDGKSEDNSDDFFGEKYDDGN